MKRLFISVFILIMITALSVYCLKELEKDSEALTEKLGEISSSALNGAVPGKKLQELDSLWDRFSFRGSLQLDSSVIDEISAEIKQLGVLARSGSDDVMPECAYLSEAISSLYRRQLPAPESIL